MNPSGGSARSVFRVPQEGSLATSNSSFSAKKVMIMNLFKRIKTRRQINKSLKANGFDRKQFKKSMQEHINRKLDIGEILSREYSDNVVVDAYEYCMRKCEWDPSTLEAGSIRDFLLCVLFEGEVANGGISQFLSNSSGDMAEETVLAIEKIGEPETATMLCEVLQCFPNGVAPKDRDARNDLMEQFDEKVEEEFDKFDQTLMKHSLSQSCYTFLQSHKNDFLCF